VDLISKKLLRISVEVLPSFDKIGGQIMIFVDGQSVNIGSFKPDKDVIRSNLKIIFSKLIDIGIRKNNLNPKLKSKILISPSVTKKIYDLTNESVQKIKKVRGESRRIYEHHVYQQALNKFESSVKLALKNGVKSKDLRLSFDKLLPESS
jgi:hypothetical protein